jgi:hypothetical protein
MARPRTIADPKPGTARRAGHEDVPRVAQLLASRGINVDHDSLCERVESQNSGVVVSGGACASWTVDAGMLHVYDIAGSGSDLNVVIRELDTIANEMFAAVLVAMLYDDDPLLKQFRSLDFVVDWEEVDVRRGKPVRLVSLVRDPTRG